jgi:hypothetical protein
MCTVFSNDPIRIKITEKDLWSISHTKGIDSCAYPSDQKDEFFIKFCCSSINPHNPNEERYKEDIENEINENFNVIQDHIREFNIHRLFNPKKSMVKETILDEKIFSKDNRYDLLLDKVKDVHRLKNNGKLFGIIENE